MKSNLEMSFSRNKLIEEKYRSAMEKLMCASYSKHCVINGMKMSTVLAKLKIHFEKEENS